MITVPWIARKKNSDAQVTVMASRLQLASAKSVPQFMYLALGAFVQVLRAPGVAGASLKAEPLKGRFWTLSSWSDKAAIGAYSASDPHRSTVSKLKPKMADSRFLLYDVVGKPGWKDAIERIKAADALAATRQASEGTPG
jgi:quinol monooxygenase YgiN